MLDDSLCTKKFVCDAIKKGFIEESNSRKRHPHVFSISQLSGCTRRAAYSLGCVEPSEECPEEESRAANLGTWEHAGLLPQIAKQINGEVEVPVTLNVSGTEIPGMIDVSHPEMVLDLKTVGEWRLQAVRRDGAFSDHIMQVAAYALAKLQSGECPKWLVLMYMDRASGEDEILVEKFTNEHVELVLDRVREILFWVNGDPDQAPRTKANGAALLGPGYSFICNSCPWLRRCWGDDAKRGEYQQRTFENKKVEELLEEYVSVNKTWSDTNTRKKEIACLLESTQHGVYGNYTYRRSPDTMVDDLHESIGIMRILGYEIPQRPQRGRLYIGMKKAKKKKRRNEGSC